MTHDTTEMPVTEKPSPPGPKLKLVEARHVRWTEPVLLLLALAVVGYAVSGMGIAGEGRGSPVGRPVVLASGGVVLAAVVAVLGWRANRRRDSVASLNNQVNAKLKMQLVIAQVIWRRGQMTRIRVQYPASAEAALATMVAPTIANAFAKRIGKPFTVHRHHARRRVVMLRPGDAAADLTAEEREKARVVAVAKQAFGAEVKVTDFQLEEEPSDKNSESSISGTNEDVQNGGSGVRVQQFTVHVTSAAKLTARPVQARAVSAVATRLPGKWNADFQLTKDQVIFTRRRPLPTLVRRECTPISPGDPDWEHIPQSVVEDGKVEKWDVSGVMAHHLKSGKTRTGKTVSMIGDAIEGARRGWQVFIVDPKWIEFLGLRGWPNVRIVGMSVPDQIVIIYHLHQLMYERYELVKQGEASETDFDRIFLILDEYRQFYGEVQAWWKSIKISGMPAECPVFEWVGSLLRMAAAARIHIILGTQRPDADFLKGEIRDNFSARSATGRLSPDGAQMMFESQRTGTTIPVHVLGRGTICGTDGIPREAQFLYTPDPRKAVSEEDRELLRQFRESTEQVWPFLEVKYPTEKELQDTVRDSEQKTVAAWVAILGATLIETEGLPPVQTPAGEPDPINGEVSDVDEGEDEPEDPYASDYAQQTSVQPHLVEVGDLVEGDSSDEWLTVTDVEPTDDGQIKMSWRDDYNNEGENWVSEDELVTRRAALNYGSA